MIRARLPLIGLIAGSLTFCASANAQTYPSKPVTFVLPFAAGGPSEPSIRRILPFLEKAWGQPVLLDAKPGAGGLIGTEFVVKAAPDGYTLLYSVAQISAYKVLVKDMRFDPSKDLAPISLTLEIPGGLIVNTQIPAKNVDEFVTYARANPGKLNYGSAGRTPQMLIIEAFKRATNTQITEVPFTAAAQIALSALRNDIQLYQGPLNSALKSQVEAGKLRPLLMIGNRRSRVFPEIPTAFEKGWNIRSAAWFGLFAPAGTPQPILDRISADVARYAATAEAQEYAKESGVDVLSSTPEQLRQLMEADTKVWADTAAAIGLKPE